MFVSRTAPTLLGQEAKTRPYKADFSADSIPQMGASLAAFNVQAKHRGYRLIGCVAQGFNAIFLRNDIAPAAFPTCVHAHSTGSLQLQHCDEDATLHSTTQMQR